MHEETLYPVCPHRNVPAAYLRFLGPDSGGMERFFPKERIRRAGGEALEDSNLFALISILLN